MKENKYDDELFYEKYSHLPRSVDGLKAAGEWHELQKMLPDFSGKRFWIWVVVLGGIVSTRLSMARSQ